MKFEICPLIFPLIIILKFQKLCIVSFAALVSDRSNCCKRHLKESFEVFAKLFQILFGAELRTVCKTIKNNSLPGIGGALFNSKIKLKCCESSQTIIIIIIHPRPRPHRGMNLQLELSVFLLQWILSVLLRLMLIDWLLI